VDPVVRRVAEQRYGAALAEVAALRRAHPSESADELADRLVRRCVRDMAIGGAMTGGAAAAPAAGAAVVAASVGVDTAYGVGRLGEMIMGIGILFGQAAASPAERRTAVLAVMSMVDSAAAGVSGLAARGGANGGARVLRRLPPIKRAAPGAAGATRSGNGRSGPWRVVAVVPYGIGAGVGAAGSALLARAVGRAAKEYFGSASSRAVRPDRSASDDEPVDGELLRDDLSGGRSAAPLHDIVDAEVVDPPATG
jgi:hypothetical protein